MYFFSRLIRLSHKNTIWKWIYSGTIRLYFSRCDLEHLAKPLFWIKSGKSLPLKQTRLRTSETASAQHWWGDDLSSLEPVITFWAKKDAKQKPVMKASWPARWPLKCSSRAEEAGDWKTKSESITFWLESFCFRFFDFFRSSSTTARKTSWDLRQSGSLEQNPWPCIAGKILLADKITD